MAPWFAIAALLMSETVAYALLSVNMHLAASLQIAETSPFYPIVQYALAFFGAGITIILSALGYRLWSSWQAYLAGRRETAVLRELVRSSCARHSMITRSIYAKQDEGEERGHSGQVGGTAVDTEGAD